MKILFFSDIHGNRYVLEPLLKVIDKENVDRVVFCGDIFGYYYYQEEILTLFRRYKFDIILGNHDIYFLEILRNKKKESDLIRKYGNSYLDIDKKISQENIKFLKKMNSQQIIHDNNLKIGIFHGTPDNPSYGRLYPDTTIINSSIYEKFDLILLGHTHHKMYREFNKTIIVNPGSIGQQRDGKGCSYAIYDTVTKEMTFGIVKYDIFALVRDIDIFDNGNDKLKEVLFREEDIK